MHISISDEHGKYQATYELVRTFGACLRLYHCGDVRVAAGTVLVIWEQPKDLREIFDVNAAAARGAIEAFNGERLPRNSRHVRRPPEVSITAKNLSCTPARENLRALFSC